MGLVRRPELLAGARTELSPEPGEHAWQAGFNMSRSEAVSVGLGDNIGLLVLAAETVDPRSQLSAWERKLITLVTGGSTDAQSAQQLFMSIRTARSHLDRIRDKTGRRRHPTRTANIGRAEPMISNRGGPRTRSSHRTPLRVRDVLIRCLGLTTLLPTVDQPSTASPTRSCQPHRPAQKRIQHDDPTKACAARCGHRHPARAQRLLPGRAGVRCRRYGPVTSSWERSTQPGLTGSHGRHSGSGNCQRAPVLGRDRAGGDCGLGRRPGAGPRDPTRRHG